MYQYVPRGLFIQICQRVNHKSEPLCSKGYVYSDVSESKSPNWTNMLQKICLFTSFQMVKHQFEPLHSWQIPYGNSTILSNDFLKIADGPQNLATFSKTGGLDSSLLRYTPSSCRLLATTAHGHLTADKKWASVSYLGVSGRIYILRVKRHLKNLMFVCLRRHQTIPWS